MKPISHFRVNPLLPLSTQVSRFCRSYLPTPTRAQNSPFLDFWYLLGNRVDQDGDLLRDILGVGGSLEKGAELLPFFFGVGGENAPLGGLAAEQIRHEDLVWVRGVGVRKDVGALLGLHAQTKDIVHDEDSGGGG